MYSSFKWCTLKLCGSQNLLSDIKYMYDVILVFGDFTQSDELLSVHADYFQFVLPFFSNLNSTPPHPPPPPKKKITSLPGKLRTEFSCPITKNPLALHYHTQLYLQCWSEPMTLTSSCAGNRTLAVCTKLDLMDHGTDALDILYGRGED